MMRLCSPQSHSTYFLLPTSPNSCANLTNFNANPNFYRTKLTINIIAVLLVKSPHISSRSCFATPLPGPVLCSESEERNAEQREVEGEGKEALEGLILSIRRPVMKSSDKAIDSCDNVDENVGMDDYTSDSKLDRNLSELAKKMPIFEPKRRVTLEQKPLRINLELGIYRAKVFTLKFKFEEAKQILQKCIWFWPEDGRAYVALGKLLCRQSKLTEARLVYEKGSQETQGENSYIWQCWAVLESKVGNIRRARELFDAATVADKKHVAAWHGWAVLEIKQGNLKKARSLLGKGLKYCSGNEYIYQTLALLESKGKRFEEARYFFQKATQCNPKSCASWLAWAQAEMQQKKYHLARLLFQKAVQASPKNRYAWHVWALFEANRGDIEKGRKLLKVGHALNPFDPVLIQSLALLEYKDSSANLARVLFRRASKIDPKHQPVWFAWGWMEWKEGNIDTARELYKRALSINSTSESAARCLQAWGVLEHRAGNLSTARMLFRSSLKINSESYVTWTTWAAFEEEQGNAERAEEIRNLYFQQRTEVVDDASWVMGFLDIIDPAIDSVKRLLNLGRSSPDSPRSREILRRHQMSKGGRAAETADSGETLHFPGNIDGDDGFDLDSFIKDKLSLDVSKLDEKLEMFDSMKSSTTKKRYAWIRRENSGLPALG